MKLKFRQKQKVKKALNRAHSPVRWIWPSLADALIGVVCILLIIFALLTYSPTVSEYTSKLVNGNKYISLVEGLFNPFRNKHLLLKSGLPIYDLKIKHQQYAIIESVIKQAKKQGWMSDDLKVWANARFIHDGQDYNVKVRVRGDLPRHWNSPKKSWRIKFGNERFVAEDGTVSEEPIYFNRTRQINLIVPIDRDFILAAFINSQMREKGLLVPRDDFVIFRINGVVQGLYYQIEHFDKPLMAYQRRPETTVFAQNDRAKHFEQYTKLGTPATSDARFDMGSLRRLVDREGELGMQAMNVLIEHSLNPTEQNFRRARAVLDWEKFLYFRVMTTLCNTNHVRFGSDNLRLYYDSSRGLLEPIPWDVHIVKMPKEPGTIDFFNTKGPDELQRATLMNPQLRLQRNRIFWDFIGDGGDSLITKYRKLHDKIRPYAWADVLTTPINGYKMDVLKKTFEYNVKRVYKVLSNSNCNFTYSLKADNLAELDLTVTNFSGIELQNVQLRDSLLFQGNYELFEDANGNGRLDADDPLLTQTTADDDWRIILNIDQELLPEVEYGADIIGGQNWEYFDAKSKRIKYFLRGKLASADRHPILWQAPEIEVAARNAVSGYQIPSAFISQREPLPDNMIGITAYDFSDPFDLDAPFYSREQFLAAHPMFQASESHSGVVELTGNVRIEGTVIVPQDVQLTVLPGTEITMAPRANVLSYGGLVAVGTPDRRIRIHGDASGRPFGVFSVVRPAKKVVVKYTDFSDASQAEINGVLFTGGFAVHEGDLELEDVRFFDMSSEDGVNLKNGRLEMRNCQFTRNESDAIDIDFGTGLVENCRFEDIGGDGVDMSGSEITIAGNLFVGVADKAISVGEKSNPTIYNNLFRGCDIAISMKDLSFARIAHCTFVDNRLALEAKRKKAMFGGGSGEVSNSVFAGNQTLLSEDRFSKGRVNISHALVDVAVSWPNSKTAAIRFVHSKSGDYRVDADSFAGNGIAIYTPDWLRQQAFYSSHPGIGLLLSSAKQEFSTTERR
ncbi:MAG: CotH kinase family protein [Calditrichaeota bacterium]|nr:CotH kinase family protein [Calditrichota bacterium]